MIAHAAPRGLRACPPDADADGGSAARTEGVQASRLEAIVRQQHAFLWRSLRRLGVPERDTDDGVQRVLAVLARRVGDVEVGKERAFLFQTALRVAAELRRTIARGRLAFDDATVDAARDTGMLPDEAMEQRQARALLDAALDELPLDVRAVFVLFELEQMTTSEIATLLALPAGTVSSRLRRGREEFQAIAKRLRAKRAFAGGAT
jgi:RNA polymerase sigma-70 factor, ECF subfamily